MTDYFAVLDQPRSAWLDVAALKEKFHERARTEHPDAGGANFEELNIAYRTLADPKSRLAYLLELTGAKPAAVTEPPADLVDLFFETGNALKGSKAMVELHLTRLTKVRDQVIEGVRTLDYRDTRQLTDAHQRLAFLDRWMGQLNEKLIQA
ncbi:MAG: hypothetical protein ACJ8I9_03160 [Chthoniobacterales bacterium]